jgi:hypothetical protein
VINRANPINRPARSPPRLGERFRPAPAQRASRRPRASVAGVRSATGRKAIPGRAETSACERGTVATHRPARTASSIPSIDRTVGPRGAGSPPRNSTQVQKASATGSVSTQGHGASTSCSIRSARSAASGWPDANAAIRGSSRKAATLSPRRSKGSHTNVRRPSRRAGCRRSPPSRSGADPDAPAGAPRGTRATPAAPTPGRRWRRPLRGSRPSPLGPLGRHRRAPRRPPPGSAGRATGTPRPAAVSSTLRVVRRNSATPSSPSRRRICSDSAGCAMYRRSAARVK